MKAIIGIDIGDSPIISVVEQSIRIGLTALGKDGKIILLSEGVLTITESSMNIAWHNIYKHIGLVECLTDSVVFLDLPPRPNVKHAFYKGVIYHWLLSQGVKSINFVDSQIWRQVMGSPWPDKQDYNLWHSFENALGEQERIWIDKLLPGECYHKAYEYIRNAYHIARYGESVLKTEGRKNYE